MVPLAAAAGALSAFAEPAVRVTHSKLGAESRFLVSVRVWGAHLHREVVNVTTTNLAARSLSLDRQWRWGLAAASGWFSGGAAAVVAAALFAGLRKPPQLRPWRSVGITDDMFGIRRGRVRYIR